MSKSITNVEETLTASGYHSGPNGTPSSVFGSREFAFPLCQREVTYGECTFPHFWMDTRTLYGDRRRKTTTHQLLIDYFWARCQSESTTDDEGVQGSYILAFLLPHARSHGSKRVLADAKLSRQKELDADKPTVAARLEVLLKSHQGSQLNNIEFRDRTANAIGPPLFEESVCNRYRQFEQELLGEGRDSLQQDGPAGLQVPLAQWLQWMKSIGRRKGNQEDKQVLDMLSYECRAALHRCYSAVWFELIPHLADRYQLSEEAFFFHRLWHLDQTFPSDRPTEAYFHLFHGHIFGLHPACGDFMLTTTGRQLVGDWMRQPDSAEVWSRLLCGLAVAIDDYAQRNEVYALLRKKQPDMIGGNDLVRIEEQQYERRSGRRRVKQLSGDAG